MTDEPRLTVWGTFADGGWEQRFVDAQLGDVVRESRRTAAIGLALACILALRDILVPAFHLEVLLPVRALVVGLLAVVVFRPPRTHRRLQQVFFVATAGFYATNVGATAWLAELPSDPVLHATLLAFACTWFGGLSLRPIVAANLVQLAAMLAVWATRAGPSAGKVVETAGIALLGCLVPAAVMRATQNAYVRRTQAAVWLNERLIDARKDLVAAVAHELRTPLAKCRFAVALATDAEESELGPMIAEADADLGRLRDLVDRVVVFGSLRPGERLPREERIASGQLIAEVAELVSTLRAEVDVEVERLTETVLPANLGLLRAALTNLASNAIRYAEGRVRLTASALDGAVVFYIDDDGPGVPLASREQIFEPLERLQHGRDRDAGGIGLGLAITRRVLTGHGGGVWVEDSPLGGARFVARVPTDQPR